MLEFQLPTGFLNGEPPSWYAIVRPGALRPSRYDGVPRQAANEAEPRIFILEQGGESDVFVSEYAEDLSYITDSWYPTREFAAEDLETRFGDQLGPWSPVPGEESNPESYVLQSTSSASL